MDGVLFGHHAPSREELEGGFCTEYGIEVEQDEFYLYEGMRGV